VGVKQVGRSDAKESRDPPENSCESLLGVPREEGANPHNIPPGQFLDSCLVFRDLFFWKREVFDQSQELGVLFIPQNDTRSCPRKEERGYGEGWYTGMTAKDPLFWRILGRDEDELPVGQGKAFIGPPMDAGDWVRAHFLHSLEKTVTLISAHDRCL